MSTRLAALPLPDWYDRRLVANPWFQPNADVIEQTADQRRRHHSVRSAADDRCRALRLHVDEVPDFTWPFTVMDYLSGKATRLLPAPQRDVLSIPGVWYQGNNQIVWTDRAEADEVRQCISLMAGRLGVPNAWNSTMRLCEWDLRNAAAITTHAYMNDFHRWTSRWNMHYWRARKNNPYGLPVGANPTMYLEGPNNPFVVITPRNCWHPVHNPDGWWEPIALTPADFDETWEYVKGVGAVTLWPKHGNRWTFGASLDPVVQAVLHDHVHLRGGVAAEPHWFPKGYSWRYEEHGGFTQDWHRLDKHDAQQAITIVNLLDGCPAMDILPYDVIIMSGQARTHCVPITAQNAIRQIDAADRPELFGRLVYLTDTMDDIPGFEAKRQEYEDGFRGKGIRLEETSTFSLVA